MSQIWHYFRGVVTFEEPLLSELYGKDIKYSDVYLIIYSTNLTSNNCNERIGAETLFLNVAKDWLSLNWDGKEFYTLDPL